MICIRVAREDELELILSWLILSAAVWLTAAILPGFHVKNFGSAVLVAAVFGVLNFLLGWLLFAVFTVVTLGIAYLLAFLTRWIINAILLVLTDKLTDHLHVDGFGWALGGALMMSVLGTVGEWWLRSSRRWWRPGSVTACWAMSGGSRFAHSR